MTLSIGGAERAELLTVEEVHYDLVGGQFELDLSLPSARFDYDEAGHSHEVTPSEWVENLKAAGFRVTSDFELAGPPQGTTIEIDGPSPEGAVRLFISPGVPLSPKQRDNLLDVVTDYLQHIGHEDIVAGKYLRTDAASVDV